MPRDASGGVPCDAADIFPGRLLGLFLVAISVGMLANGRWTLFSAWLRHANQWQMNFAEFIESENRKRGCGVQREWPGLPKSLQIGAEKSAGGWTFRCDQSAGWRLFKGKPDSVDLSTIRGAVGDQHPGLRTLRSILDSPLVRMDGGGLFVPDDLIAQWEIAPGELADIGLPPLCSFRLSLSADQPITSQKGNLKPTWLDAKHRPVPAVERDGTLIQSGRNRYLLRDPLRSLVDAIDYMNAALDIDERLRRFSAVQARILETTQQVVAPDNLKSMVIYQATGLGIKTSVGPDGYHFEPELLGDLPGAEEDEGPQRSALLNRSEANSLSRRIMQAESDGNLDPKPSYVLVANTYVVLDPGVRAALGVVRRVDRADKATRQDFFDDKMSFLLPALREAGSDGSVVEFSDRVIGVVPWEHGSKLGGSAISDEWFPDVGATTYVVKDAKGREVLLSGPNVTDQVKAIKTAIAEGKASVELNGKSVPVDRTMLDDLARIPIVEEPSSGRAKAKERSAPKTYYYVKPKANIDAPGFVEALGKTRPAELSEVLGLKNLPKSYQMEGIEWFQHGYISGMRGMLMADDMGLGKTFQVLAFLRWLRLGMGAKRPLRSGPRFLIVAPKTLLGNWLEEVESHLPEGGLGKPALIFGESLKEYRKDAGRDILKGRDVLDREKIKQFDWVLTTYETLRDYQISFALIGFEIIVFDEAQKIKESGAMVTEAARSQKAASLRVLMTGTPVENGLMDLWTLMDVMWPGRIGYTAKEFRKKFLGEDAAEVESLKRFLTEPQKDGAIVVPALMLRRMKEAVTDLKPKHFRPVPKPMPTVQAQAYAVACEQQKSQPGGTLMSLQAIRNISLHPDLGARIDFGKPQSVENFIGMSARLVGLFEILDQIKQMNERALVFVDLRRAQSVVAELIKYKYSLEFLPHVINGETLSAQRDSIRRGFQKRRGFEVLILAPRAAGFGLTLHSANHVVHLNRWWNPAVEDQCTDRVYRLGQEREVMVWLPIAEHSDFKSYDVLLNERLERKRAASRDVIVPVRFDAREIARLHSEIFGGDALDEELASMDWHRFEDWTCDQIKSPDIVVNKTPQVSDGGADLIVRLSSDQERGGFVQVKHRTRGKTGLVSEGDVLDVLRAKDRYPVLNPMFFLVTNGSVEPRGVKIAETNGIRIIDYSRMSRMGEIVRASILSGM